MLQKYIRYAIYLAWLCSSQIQAQTPRTFILITEEDGKYLQQKPLSDSLSFHSQINQLLNKAIAAGRLSASIDSSYRQGDTVYSLLSMGLMYQWASLRRGNAEEDVLSYTGYRQKLYDHKRFVPAELSRMLEKILQYYENHGYPFASVKLDSVVISQHFITAALNVDKNQLFTIDSIEIVGNANIKRSYMYDYTGIKPGRLYNENLLKQMDKRVNQLSFARVSRPLNIYYTGSRARVICFVDHKKASQVDGIIGFAPRSAINNKLVLSGEINMNLQNLFSSGKVFEVHYRSFLVNSQDLKVRLLYPYLFHSPVGIDYNFALLKFDSTYLQLESDFGFQYALGGSNYLKVFYNTQSTSLLHVDTQAILLSRRLPEFADMKNNLYGLAVKMNFLDYTPNPRKGILIESSMGAGVKRILQNNSIRSLQFQDAKSNTYNLYDSLQLRSIQYKASLMIDKYWALAGKSALRTQLNAATLNAKEIFTNELFRIGGIRTLKGFDEQSIFASSYAILNVEYRYLLNRNSSFIVFANAAWYERSTRNSFLSDTPTGFGSGLNLETAAGIFSLYYALGQQFNNPFQLRQGKVHFGIVNYF